MAKYKKILIWSLINNKPHPRLSGDEDKISGSMPIIDELFPGINYYSVSGFVQVKENYLRPVLTKLFPNLGQLSAEEVGINEKVDVQAFLPSKGYEHQDNPKWKLRLEELLNRDN